MRTDAHRHAGTRRHTIRATAPAPILHALPLGEDFELFPDRLEDAVEYDAIMHDFAALHDAEVAADTYSS